jgi:CheY-specific phosphatase CheX
MVLDQYLEVLANNCRDILEEMTQFANISVEVRKVENRQNTRFSTAHIIPYHDFENTVGGDFLLGFEDEKMALSVASSIAQKIGLPPLETFDTTASDILNEFMNTVVGRAITAWDSFGFKVNIGTPVEIRSSPFPKADLPLTETFQIILKPQVDVELAQLIFIVTFTFSRAN